MAQPNVLRPDEIRDALTEHNKLRARDLAKNLGISEAQILAAQTGAGVTRINANPDMIMTQVPSFGEVMALTRNEWCVHERVGAYGNYHSGAHASMILADEIDLRIFRSHWMHAFAVEKESEAGTKRSLQVFDAAGDSIHKIHLRAESDIQGWDAAVTALATGEVSQTLEVTDRLVAEPAKTNPEKRDILLKEWDLMTDTHQFMRLTAKLKMNRLGAYRIAGKPYARALAPSSVQDMLTQVQTSGAEVMVFVGNRGCIQIHSGPIEKLVTMGQWENVMDPRFNLHLRADHVAEVWAVEKPTQRGPARSFEAFDAEGSLVFQVFPLAKEGRDNRDVWRSILESLPEADVMEPAE
ncbi:hemin-degrading factor [Falsihalocynthiibacter arcticus]|uniref:Hemin degrading factor n=1 Tax=Falsihalocynthiibacter arcticus TaxID=1579316 RepID=A0A126V0F4_9RHOB|nr:hemin-degrading factor [Falsihalocynthiibacter arcticus]AML51802.1 hemin degrading factor [Falsihalocynthiibacter arcticus]